MPDFDAQSFANTLRAMTKTSRLLCEILDVLDPDVQSFANTLQAVTETSRPLPEILGVPDFDVQSFANTLRDMAKTSRPRPEILDVLDLDAQSFAHTLRAMAKTSRPPLPEILDVPTPPQASLLHQAVNRRLRPEVACEGFHAWVALSVFRFLNSTRNASPFQVRCYPGPGEGVRRRKTPGCPLVKRLPDQTKVSGVGRCRDAPWPTFEKSVFRCS